MVRIHVGEPLYFQSLTRICMQIVYLCEKKVCELIFLLNVHFSTRAWIPDLFQPWYRLRIQVPTWRCLDCLMNSGAESALVKMRHIVGR